MIQPHELQGISLENCPFDTARKRAQLPHNRHNVHWWAYQRGRGLGYRKNQRTAAWYARIRLRNKRYEWLSLGREGSGRADEHGLTFETALSRAIAWADANAHRAIPILLPYEQEVLFPELPEAPPVTVGHAVADYVEWQRWNLRSMKQVFYAARHQIIPHLGHLVLDELTPRRIDDWMAQMVRMPPRQRACAGKVRYQTARPYDPAYIRRRKNTANRHLEILKQALNHALRHGYVHGDSAWRIVRPFQGVDQPRDVRYLTLEECRALVAACPPDLEKLVRAALATGARAGDLRAMRAKQYDAARGHLTIFSQKTDHLYGHTLTVAGRKLFDGLAKGQQGEDHLFLRADGMPWTQDGYNRPFKRACRRAGLPSSICFHTLRHTHASHAVMNGLPLAVLARQMGLKSTKMIERYYAHLDTSYIGEEVRAKMPELG